jgi:hypothetical protein
MAIIIKLKFGGTTLQVEHELCELFKRFFDNLPRKCLTRQKLIPFNLRDPKLTEAWSNKMR